MSLYSMMMTTTDLAKRYQDAVEAVRVAESAGRTERTMNKYYKAMFAAEDALKAVSGGWAR